MLLFVREKRVYDIIVSQENIGQFRPLQSISDKTYADFNPIEVGVELAQCMITLFFPTLDGMVLNTKKSRDELTKTPHSYQVRTITTLFSVWLNIKTFDKTKTGKLSCLFSLSLCLKFNLKLDHSSQICWAVLSVVLFVMLYKVVLTFDSVYAILQCNHSNLNNLALCYGMQSSLYLHCLTFFGRNFWPRLPNGDVKSSTLMFWQQQQPATLFLSFFAFIWKHAKPSVLC